jgi:hypothetical protein
MVYIFLCAQFALAIFSSVIQKKTAGFLLNGRAIFEAFCVCQTGVIACVFFFIMSGFQINFSRENILFALIFSLVCTASLPVGFYAINNIDVAGLTVFRSGAAMIISYILGVILFSEDTTPKKIIQLLLTLAAVLLVYLEQRKKNEGGIGFLKKILTLISVSLIASMATLVSKYYTIIVGSADANSFFFITNLFQIGFGVVGVLIIYLKSRPKREEMVAYFKPKNLLITSLNTVNSNLASLLNLFILSLMEVTVYSPIGNTITLLAGGVASLILRQRLGKYSVMAISLSVLTVLAFVFI